MNLPANFYSTVFKVSYLVALLPTLSVTIAAALSIKHLGGTLGRGLKKIAAGSIVHTIVIATFLLIEHGNRGLLSDLGVRLFFIASGLLGSILLIIGYIQIYKIAKKLKLFTI